MNSIQYKILFASSEVFPLIKTGGLADVSQALPCALHELNQDVRIIMPAYRNLNNLVKKSKLIASQVFLEGDANLYETTLPESDVVVWLVDCPTLYDREGGPYLDDNDEPWEDNAQRFALFSRVITAIAANKMQLQWCPGILHCNDWQTALAPALLQYEKSKPGIVFTIHNLVYQGVFPLSIHSQLQLPDELASLESMEFYGQFSFIKGGILYADQVSTVSPTYAQEIQTKEYGAGLEALLKINSHKLSGILNGINEDEWNPAKDKHLYEHYNSKSLELKAKNKLALQKDLNFICDEKIPLFATISRLVSQKGIDLIIEILPKLANENIQVVILGKGDPELEEKLNEIAHANANRFYIRVGYDEALAHKITAAADFFMMPSRFEPCGLNQMYSQHYGTIPIVRKTGGLADTVIEKQDSSEVMKNTGITFEQDNSNDFLAAMLRGLEYYTDVKMWKKIQLNAMQQDFSWKNSAQQYIKLYSKILT